MVLDCIDSLYLPSSLLKTLLPQGIPEPIFYGDLVYKLKRIVGKPSFLISKRPSSVIKEWDTAWMLCDSLHAWL